MAKACVILYNCCVEERIEDGDINSLDIYDFDYLPESDRPITTEIEIVSEEQLVRESQEKFEDQRTQGNISSDVELQRSIRVVEILPLRTLIAQRRWEKFYDLEEN